MASLIPNFQPKKHSISLLLINTSFLFLLSFYLETQHNATATIKIWSSNQLADEDCSALHDQTDYNLKCFYVRTHMGCKPKGYIDYLQLFYCTSLGPFPHLGLLSLLLWLLILFYLLGNTATNYFCSSLESLSRVLKLSPTIAGITLLSLGNGAPDVFSSIISFTRSGNGDLGLNIVLGGTFFISSIVVGIISILISPHDQEMLVDKSSFIRNVVFFLFSLVSLLVILVVGRINLLGAICFVSIYLVYVCFSTTHFCPFGNSKEKKSNLFSDLSSDRNDQVIIYPHKGDKSFEETAIPLLGCIDDEKSVTSVEDQVTSYIIKLGRLTDEPRKDVHYYLSRLVYVLGLPLELPRRMTIPVVSEEKWSKPYAVISVTLAPILLSFLCNTQRENVGFKDSMVTYMAAGFIGLVLGNLAYATTSKFSPPKQCVLPWLVGGFLMCVTWTYIIAEELVSLLISLGLVFGISPPILGLTVLAWGNSMGDLITNVAMAINGGPDGAQIAIAGCYAGPLFNVVVGLGLSLVFSSWSVYPSAYLIPTDTSLYETVGFLMASLLWALVVLPKRKMRLDRSLGCGLVAIYLCFLFLRLVMALGILQARES